MRRKDIYRFVIALLAVSWLAQFFILREFGGPEAPAAVPFMLLVMFLPGLFGLAYAIFSKDVRRTVNWMPRNALPLLLAILVPMGIAFGAITIVGMAGIGHSDYFQFGLAGVVVASGPWLFGIGEQAWPTFLANVFATTTVYACITGLATIGEEYGWRGVLQNALIREFGFGRGVTLLGFVWGIWHFPIILAGYNYPDAPVLGAFVFMPLLLIAASFIMAWLTLWNGSFWPAVIMHGAINSVYDSLATRVSLIHPNDYLLDLLEIGLFALIAGVAVRLARPYTESLNIPSATARY